MEDHILDKTMSSDKPVAETQTNQPTLDELLEKACHRVMTPEEKEAQRQSWVRGELGIDEAERKEGSQTTVFPPLPRTAAPPAAGEREQMSIVKNKSTETNRQFWSHVESVSLNVSILDIHKLIEWSKLGPQHTLEHTFNCICDRAHKGILDIEASVVALRAQLAAAQKRIKELEAANNKIRELENK